MVRSAIARAERGDVESDRLLRRTLEQNPEFEAARQAFGAWVARGSIDELIGCHQRG